MINRPLDIFSFLSSVWPKMQFKLKKVCSNTNAKHCQIKIHITNISGWLRQASSWKWELIGPSATSDKPPASTYASKIDFSNTCHLSINMNIFSSMVFIAKLNQNRFLILPLSIAVSNGANMHSVCCPYSAILHTEHIIVICLYKLISMHICADDQQQQHKLLNKIK